TSLLGRVRRLNFQQASALTHVSELQGLQGYALLAFVLPRVDDAAGRDLVVRAEEARSCARAELHDVAERAAGHGLETIDAHGRAPRAHPAHEQLRFGVGPLHVGGRSGELTPMRDALLAGPDV